MSSNKLRGKDLRKINYPDSKSISIALGLMSKHFKHSSKSDKLTVLSKILNKPDEYIDHETMWKLANALLPAKTKAVQVENALLDVARPFHIHGKKLINENTIDQMELAMRLPVAIKGALMPDAHHGYGLPIGGVLATKNAVIPYGVGLDIGCRMSLTLYDCKADFINRHGYQIKTTLKQQTNFGTGGSLTISQEHEILDRQEFNLTEVLRSLHTKAVKQLGTSGSGNHFVEFGHVSLASQNSLNLPTGNYLGILAHSGSRGMGATIAQYYTRAAIAQCPLPRKVQHLAWLDLDTELGQEYWMSMNLAGDYAKACHDKIHERLAKQLGIRPIGKIENHHNFAWKEVIAGEEFIIHRKGATPAAKGELGIIPGSMTSNAFIVEGMENESALNSASHGAGRKLSRRKAKSTLTRSELKKELKKHGVTLIGGNVDESPAAYKNIDNVMNHQQNLIKVIGSFTPKIVRMDKI